MFPEFPLIPPNRSATARPPSRTFTSAVKRNAAVKHGFVEQISNVVPLKLCDANLARGDIGERNRIDFRNDSTRGGKLNGPRVGGLLLANPRVQTKTRARSCFRLAVGVDLRVSNCYTWNGTVN